MFFREETIFLERRIEAIYCAESVVEFLIASVFEENCMESRGEEDLTGDDKVEQGSIIADDRNIQDGEEHPVEFKNFQKQLLYQLLITAIEMIKLGENIDYTFANIFPNLFYQTKFPDITAVRNLSYLPSFCTKKSILQWKVNKNEFALRALKFTNDCLSINSVQPFQICGLVIPKVAKNIDVLVLPENVKMKVLLS